MNRAKKGQDSVTLRAMGNTNPDPEARNLADEPEMNKKKMTLNKITTLATLGLIAATLPLGQTHADQFEEAKPNNWHHWRGPDANGVSTTAKPPVQWSPTNNIQWKAPVEGNGSSTPIIWGNKLFVLTAINTGEVDPTLPKPGDQPKRVFGITHPNTSYEFVVLK